MKEIRISNQTNTQVFIVSSTGGSDQGEGQAITVTTLKDDYTTVVIEASDRFEEGEFTLFSSNPTKPASRLYVATDGTELFKVADCIKVQGDASTVGAPYVGGIDVSEFRLIYDDNGEIDITI